MPHLSFEAKLQKNRRFTERLADDINRIAGNFTFFIVHVAGFTIWILGNSGKIPNFPIIDPFPFNLLTMMVSLEAIFLSIFVLMSQNRQSAVASLREEIHLQINEIAEREVTKALKLLAELHHAQFPKSEKDEELEKMLEKLDTGKIEAELEKELEPKPMVISELFDKVEELVIKRPRNGMKK